MRRGLVFFGGGEGGTKAGARPTHAVWQGKVYHIGGAVVRDGVAYADFKDATGYGTGAGLCGWNCRHNFFPFWPGASVRNYDDAKLAELAAKTETYRGQQYTKYEISQMQRALERKVRGLEKRYVTEDAAGVDAGNTAARLAGTRTELRQFIKDTGGKVDGARTAVPGVGRSQATKASVQARNLQFIQNDATMKASSGLPSEIPLADGKLPHTVEVNLDKLHGVVPKGTDTMQVYAMAGDGTSTPIRDLRRLYATYPDYGPASGWQKVSGTVHGKYHHYVVHWYSNHGKVPQVEIKLKGAK